MVTRDLPALPINREIDDASDEIQPVVVFGGQVIQPSQESRGHNVSAYLGGEVLVEDSDESKRRLSVHSPERSRSDG